MKKIIFFIMVCAFQISYASEVPTKPKGLINLGNTCYLNSVVQCLLPNESFCNAILSYKPQPSDNEKDKELTLSLQSFIHEMRNSPNMMYPYKLVNSANQCTFGVGQAGIQQDAEEFFLKFIDHLYPKPALNDLFEIKYTYKRSFADLKITKKNNLSYLNISYDYLPVEKRTSGTAIETLIRSFFSIPKKALVEGKNRAGVIGEYPMIEENNFSEASDILVVTAPRVDEQFEKHMIPIWTLNQPFFISEKDDPTTKYWYSIIGAVLHTGSSLKNGHYAAVSRYGDQWYFCNDETIEPINEGRLGSILQGEPQGLMLRQKFQTYLFFFERIKKQRKPFGPSQIVKKFPHVEVKASSSSGSGSLSDID